MKGVQEAETNANGNSSNERDVINPDVVKCFNWNPLHAAASRGEVHHLRTLLASNSELVEALDSHQRSLLHLASANGHVKVVEALIEVRPEMCLARDRDGANPLHVAAMRGNVKVLDVLFRANPLAALARVDRRERETILHLCVKYNKVEFLKELLKKYFKSDEFVNSKDDAGNTILHLAVAHQKSEIISLVLKHKKIDVNARNASKQTAMDIQILREEQAVLTKPEGANCDIKALLHKSRAKRNMEAIDPQWLREKRTALIIVAVLIATIAFEAGVTPPGGVWPDDSVEHKAGEAVMAYNYPNLYRYFLRSNTIGFVTSLSTILLLISELPLTDRRYVWVLVAIMCVTFTSMAFTYAFSITVITPSWKRKALSHTVVVAVVVWCSVIATVLLLIVIRFITGIVCFKRAKAVVGLDKSPTISPGETQNHDRVRLDPVSVSEANVDHVL